MIDDPKRAGIPTEQARQLIVKAFADWPDVVGISMNFSPTVWRVRVITRNGDVYDPDAMAALLERENPLLQQLGSVVIDFDYRKLRSRPLEQLIPRNHLLIYRR
jgi:hypothetical protein